MIGQWLDSDFRRDDAPNAESLPDKMNWERTLPFIFLHLGCLAVFLVGFSWISAGTAVFLYLLRMFAITGFYHRYFSHRSFKTSRVVQFFFRTFRKQLNAAWATLVGSNAPSPP